jgi:hypothetical protein
MRLPFSPIAFAGCFGLVAACSHNPPPAAPAPQPAVAPAPMPAAAPAPRPAAAPSSAVDLTGDWDFVADLSGREMGGVVQLARSGSGYTGSATPANANGSAPLSSITITGSSVVMVFDTPNGDARIQATLSGVNEMKGTVQYAGYSGNFTAHRH